MRGGFAREGSGLHPVHLDQDFGCAISRDLDGTVKILVARLARPDAMYPGSEVVHDKDATGFRLAYRLVADQDCDAIDGGVQTERSKLLAHFFLDRRRGELWTGTQSNDLRPRSHEHKLPLAVKLPVLGCHFPFGVPHDARFDPRGQLRCRQNAPALWISQSPQTIQQALREETVPRFLDSLFALAARR